MPRLHHPGVDLLVAYLVLNLVAGWNCGAGRLVF
jgi:hypothetical protein